MIRREGPWHNEVLGGGKKISAIRYQDAKRKTYAEAAEDAEYTEKK